MDIVGDILDLIEWIIGLVLLGSMIWSATKDNGWNGFLTVTGILVVVFLFFTGLEKIINYINNNHPDLFLVLLAVLAVFLIGLFIWGVYAHCQYMDEETIKNHIKNIIKDLLVIIGIIAVVLLILYFILNN